MTRVTAKCPGKCLVWESWESVCRWSGCMATGLQQVEVNAPVSKPPVVQEVIAPVAEFEVGGVHAAPVVAAVADDLTR
jgi:hypothetical protein